MYKLILMDYSMPILDGPTATFKIRKLLAQNEEFTKDYPYICLLSAYKEDAFHRKAIESGMNATSTKPIFKDSLHKLLIKASIIN